MAGTEYEFNPVTHITTGAIGPAGKRVFYLQARQTSEIVTLIVEKAQIQSLAVGLTPSSFRNWPGSTRSSTSRSLTTTRP